MHAKTILFSITILLFGCQSLPPQIASPDGSMCTTIFTNGTHRFLGRGYAEERKHNAGFLWMSLKPVQALDDGRYQLSAKMHSFFGAELYKEIDFSEGYCADTPVNHFSVIELSSKDGSKFSLWFWGAGGMPQHKDRLMGYASFSGTKVQESKVALWYR